MKQNTITTKHLNQNNMENSAVEWLYNIMYKHKGNITISEYKQAKIMEKQQIMNAWVDGALDTNAYINFAEQYYNETFNK